MVYDVEVPLQNRDIELYADIMFVEGEAFFISVSSPMALTMTCHISDRKTETIEGVMQQQILTYQSYGFHVNCVHADNEKGIVGATNIINHLNAKLITA